MDYELHRKGCASRERTESCIHDYHRIYSHDLLVSRPDIMDVADLKMADVVVRVCSVLEDVSLNHRPSPSNPPVRRYTESDVGRLRWCCLPVRYRAMQSRGVTSRINSLDLGET